MKNSKKNIQIATPLVGESEWNATKECFDSGWLTQGPKVREFEDSFAKIHNVKHAIATTSCTTGLHLMMIAGEIGPGDEVIVPAFTWVSTANVVMYTGAKVVFADVDPLTNNVTVETLKKQITNKTKAIIVVHLFGLCVDIDEIKKNINCNIRIFEDCACAAGARINNKYAGSLGDAGVFSFHPRKSITTGEGGMLTTNDDSFARKVNILRNHGASISEEERHNGPKPYLLPEFNDLGFNYRMTDIQGAIGFVQLQKLDKIIFERNKWAQYYIEKLKNIEWIQLPFVPSNISHAWQSFVIFIKSEIAPMSRNEIIEKLQIQGISTRPGTHAVHMLGYYKKKYNLEGDDFPGAKSCNDNTVSIPLHNRMSKEDYEYVVESILSL